MPELNQSQLLFLFFAIGAFVAFVSPLNALFMGIAMLVLGWKRIFNKKHHE